MDPRIAPIMLCVMRYGGIMRYRPYPDSGMPHMYAISGVMRYQEYALQGVQL